MCHSGYARRSTHRHSIRLRQRPTLKRHGADRSPANCTSTTRNSLTSSQRRLPRRSPKLAQRSESAGMPLVSIITPSWNVEGLIGATIESVQAQTFGDWELLIADDCSTDQTRSVVERYAASDPLIKLIRQPRNGGPALARQAAIEQAQGRFLAFLDSDDLWLPAKLERQVAFARRHRAALSFTAFRRINETGSVTGRLIPVPDTLNYGQLLKNTSIATLT